MEDRLTPPSSILDPRSSTPADTDDAPHTRTLLAILGSLNVCSKEWIIRQYDHEVQAGSVVKPLVGIHSDGPSDAAVVRPDLRSRRGLVVSCGMNPRYGDLDPYWMAASAIDEAVRNCVAVGADPRRIALLDNFCWGNTDRPETLGTLVRAALGCHDIALAYGTPFISGKDSLNNEFTYREGRGSRVEGRGTAGEAAQDVSRTVAIPPSLLISALGQMEDVNRAVTTDLKEAGNRLYLVGVTRDELGGSHLRLIENRASSTTHHSPLTPSDHGPRTTDHGRVPRVDPELAPRLFAAVHDAIRRGLVRSCHDLSEGGLAVAAAEMAFAGGLGVELELAPLADSTGLPDDVLLFSESNTRFLLEVPDARAADLESRFAGLPLALLGRVTEVPQIRITGADGRPLIDVSCDQARSAWKRPLAWD